MKILWECLRIKAILVRSVVNPAVLRQSNVQSANMSSCEAHQARPRFLTNVHSVAIVNLLPVDNRILWYSKLVA